MRDEFRMAADLGFGGNGIRDKDPPLVVNFNRRNPAGTGRVGPTRFDSRDFPFAVPLPLLWL